ncbi:efflux RND transporter permease subunit [Algihabitans albus]|uniref:efflux RND transporter permease subunit n=1 Tax=Algihabitans albus TaxID=2164067 RepID=UPI000E5D15BC|nr:efflux RND transporter permease subunit [Algihabitans albus]
MFGAIVTRPTLVAVAMLLVCLLGLVAALRLPVQMIPDLEVRTITIVTTWPGATPQDIEKDILIEQEEYLRRIPSLERLISRASSGRAEIELEFPFDVDITETLIRVNNALNQVPDYPLNVDQPRVFAASFSANAFMHFGVGPLPGNPHGLDMTMMRDFVEDEVRTRMESVPGVEQVDVRGGAAREVQVLIDAMALAEHGVSIADLRTALSSRNVDVSAGEVDNGKRRYLLRTVGRFDDVAAIEALVVRRMGDSVTRLGDVAGVRFHHAEATERSFVDGQPVLNLSVRREAGSNVIAIKYAVLDTMAEINRTVLEPAGMRLALTSEDVGYVEASIANVWQNLALGSALATLVMFAFLRSVRATAVGVLGIPVCTIAAFIGLLAFGRTVNVISLAGVAFAIGMTLDNSIVVLEAIDQARRRGLDRVRAAIEGVASVWTAVVASTFTTVLVFVPILFIALEAGQLYSDVAVAVSASILCSMIVAVTVVPAAAALIDLSAAGKVAQTRVRTVERLVAWLIGGTVRPIVTIAATVVASWAVVVLLTPPPSYLPEGEEPKTFAVMTAPPGYNLATMTEISLDIQDRFLPYLGDDPARFARGEVDVPALNYFIMLISAERLLVITESTDPDQLGALMDALTEKYESYPGMRAFATRGSIISSNDGGTRSINLDVSGADLAEVYAATRALYDRAGAAFDNPRLNATPPTLSLSQPMIEIRPDWTRAAELGLSVGDLGFAVASLTDGAFAGEFFRGDDKIDIYFYSADHTASFDRLGQMPLHTPAGIVPIADVAEIRQTIDTSTIRRIDGARTVTLNIIPPGDVPLSVGVERVRSDVLDALRQEGAIPAGVSVSISGASDQLDATQTALTENYVVAVAIVYLLLVAIFSHWGLPLLIMTAIPLGVAGGILGLVLMNAVGALLPAIGLPPISQPFDMISMLGFLILMGTVVNNPILIVERAVTNARERGFEAREAVVEAVRSRSRPIAMSTMTTACGLAPLVFMPGEGTELYRGVGAIVLFGILGAAVISLTFLPALTSLALRVGQGRGSEQRIPAPGE